MTAHQPVFIKNCGLKTPEHIACAVTTGASFLGFVHHTASPRHVHPSEIAALYQVVPPDVARVVVLVDPLDDLLDTLPTPNYWQVHEVYDPARLNAIHARTQTPVIAGIRVRSAADIALAHTLQPAAAHILFDAYHASEAGGTGHMFDWNLLRDLALPSPWFLAGGLTAENVAQAIALTHAPMVDVSSGLETAPGVKSFEKIAAFNQAVLHNRL